MNASGAVIMSIFGAIWWFVGARATGRVSTTFNAIPAVITLALLVAALRTRATDEPGEAVEESRRERLVATWSGVSIVLVLLEILLLRGARKDEYIATVAAAIIGLHFIPLARGLPMRRYFITALMFVAVSVASLWVDDVSERLWLVSAASACLLWLTSATVV